MLLLTAHRRNFSDWQLKGKERFYYFFTTFQSENTSRFKKICEYLPYIKCRKCLKQQTIVKNYIRVYLKSENITTLIIPRYSRLIINLQLKASLVMILTDVYVILYSKGLKGMG